MIECLVEQIIVDNVSNTDSSNAVVLTTLITSITTVLVSIIYLIGKWISKRSSEDAVKKVLDDSIPNVESIVPDGNSMHSTNTYLSKDKSGRVLGLLHLLLNETDADRISIIQSHPPQLPKWVSCSFEVVTARGRDVSLHKDRFQFSPIEKWLGTIPSWKSETPTFYDDISEIKDDSLLYELYTRGTKMFLTCGLFGNNNQWKGVLWIEWTHSDNIKDIESVKNKLRSYQIQLSNLIEYKQ